MRWHTTKSGLIPPQRIPGEPRERGTMGAGSLSLSAGFAAGPVGSRFGSGPGFWTLPLASIVGSVGRVWAIDASRELLDDLAARTPPAQVQIVESVLPNTGLPMSRLTLPGSPLYSTRWNHRPVQCRTAPDREAGRRRGRARLAARRSGRGWSPRAHRVGPNQVVRWLQAAGFTQAGLTWQDDDSYLVQAR